MKNYLKRKLKDLGSEAHHRGNYDYVALAHYEAGLQSAKFYLTWLNLVFTSVGDFGEGFAEVVG